MIRRLIDRLPYLWPILTTAYALVGRRPTMPGPDDEPDIFLA